MGTISSERASERAIEIKHKLLMVSRTCCEISALYILRYNVPYMQCMCDSSVVLLLLECMGDEQTKKKNAVSTLGCTSFEIIYIYITVLALA